MNVSLHKLLLGLLLFLAVPLIGSAQEVFQETYRNNPLDYNFASYPWPPNIISRPANGTATITNKGQNNFRLTYTPNAEFVGTDQVKFSVWDNNTWSIRKLNIQVLPSKVIAKPDIVYTHRNTGVDIDVLVNDYSSSGQLELKSILLVNNGQAEIVDGEKVVFYGPSEDFRGIAHLNYVACDQFGSCDQGTVSINVLGEPGEQVDTLKIFTKKNQSQAILIANAFRVVVPPANGSFNASGDLPIYTPNVDFVGTDYIQFGDGEMEEVVEITVLDLVDNVFAFDDELFTTSYDPLEFNVLQNDFYGLSSGCLEIDQPEFGRVEKNVYPNGSLTYYPTAGFQGVDKFTYTVNSPNCDMPAEQATVYVYVSDFEPAYSKFQMVTPKKTPLIIGYNVPINNFDFQITDNGELGTARFLRGRVDTTIYGERIKGYNIIVYIPNSEVNSGTDEFEVLYCVTKNGNCQARKIVKIEVDILDVGDGDKPMCFDDCIWAGDTNFDGIVNMEDLMPLGLFMGEIGSARDDIDLLEWYGQYGNDWGKPSGSNISDLKHVDTNGDSIVTAKDTTAISVFYGRTHSLSPSRVPNYKHSIVLQGDVFVNPGDLVELDMVLGFPNDPAIDVYGFTVPLEYNPDFFQAETARIDFIANSWLSYNSPVLYMAKNDNAGLLEAGFTRTNGIAATGFGKVGKMRIVVDDINGFRPEPGQDEIVVPLGGGVATLTNGNGQSFGVKIQDVNIHINLKQPDEQELKNPAVASELLKVFPNPANDFINLHLNGGHEFQRVQIFNLAGQLILDSGSLNTRSRRLNISLLQNGIYFLNVVTEQGVIRKKFEVVR